MSRLLVERVAGPLAPRSRDPLRLLARRLLLCDLLADPAAPSAGRLNCRRIHRLLSANSPSGGCPNLPGDATR